jgi:hypothetical protein
MIDETKSLINIKLIKLINNSFNEKDKRKIKTSESFSIIV